MSYNQLFIEALREGYPTSIFTESELKFVTSKEIIEVRRDRFWPKFVGEFTTPENSYFSLPKNFQPTDENVELFKKVLQNYKDLKGTDGKTLITNNTFAVSQDGQLKSEKFFYNELKEFFLDYITYEYIYPSKQKKIHSTSPISSGKVDVFSTMRTRKQKGPGITYKVKDIENTEDWNLDDIYWSTINELSTKYATEDDTKQISEMRSFLEDQGYKFKTIDISDKDQIIKEINKCDVGIIHQPIKNTLIDYFKSRKIGESFSLRIFYTKNFALVWEEICRHSLKESKKFRYELESKFNRIENRRKWFATEKEIEDFATVNKISIKSKEVLRNGFRVDYEIESKSIPDIFSEYNSKRFIGDAKYYQDPENAEFEKEFRTYNSLIENQYPMVVFVPSASTRVLHVREESELELVIFSISVEDAIADSINNSNKTIRKVHLFLEEKGYTKRW